MLFLDVNICVAAIRPDSSDQANAVRDWLEPRLSGHIPVGISDFVLSAMIRIATHPRIFATPTSPGKAMTFAEALRTAPAAETVRSGQRHWSIFQSLVAGHRLRGNDVPDAYLASLALEHGATFVTLDRGFGRFAGLKLLDPLA